MKKKLILLFVIGVSSVAGAALTFDYPQTVAPGETVTVTIGTDSDITIGVGDLKFVVSDGSGAVVVDLSQGPLSDADPKVSPWNTMFIEYPTISISYQTNGFSVLYSGIINSPPAGPVLAGNLFQVNFTAGGAGTIDLSIESGTIDGVPAAQQIGSIAITPTGPTHTLTTQVINDIGGSISANPAGPTYSEDTEVTLTALPEAGYRVKSWSGANNKWMLSTNTVTMSKNRKVKVEFEAIPADQVTKATFRAGKTRESEKDRFIISGTLSANQSDIIDTSRAPLFYEILVQLGTAAEPNIFEDTIVIVDEAKFRFTDKDRSLRFTGRSGRLGSLKVNINKGTFILAAIGLDLQGLSSPAILTLDFGNYSNTFTLDETIINKSKYIPIQYLSGHTDTLRVTKAKVNKNADKLTVNGEIAAIDADVNLNEKSVVISWGGYEFTIPADALTDKGKKKFKCSKVQIQDGPLVWATIDLTKCTYKITAKNCPAPPLTDQGDVPFGIQFGDFVGSASYNMD